MSLKDRLNQNTTPNNALLKEELQEEIQYYSSNEAKEEINTLGVVDTLLADDDINSIFVYGAKNIYINKNGKSFKSSSEYKDETQYENLIKKYIKNDKNCYIKLNHSPGVNVEIVMPPLSEKITLSAKVYKDNFATLQNLQENQAISKETALVLEAFSAIKCNILIVGEKNTLKTSLLSATAKKIPPNFRGVMLDFSNELKIKDSNFSNFDFSAVKNKEDVLKIFNAITLSSPEKIFINDIDDCLMSHFVKKANDGLKGISVALEAKTPEIAIEKIIYSIIKNNPEFSYEKAKLMAYKAFDIIIFVTQENGSRRLSSLSELNISPTEECSIREIFTSKTSSQIRSTGLTPDFYEIIKLSSLPVSANIFDENYKHTYFQNSQENTSKKLNIDILKKFKKDLPAREDIEVNPKKIEEEKNIETLFNYNGDIPAQNQELDFNQKDEEDMSEK